ncbi:MAG: TetR/AcrR family transcriptional regulator [Oscillospiraceae bacterium]
MNNTVTCAQDIICGALALSKAKGLCAISIRGVATQCGISIGSVYNYFPSKTALVVAVVENVWKSIFHMDSCDWETLGFEAAVQRIFQDVTESAKEYPEFLSMHASGFKQEGKTQGKTVMDEYLAHMKLGLLACLEKDTRVKQGCFDAGFTKVMFVDFVFENLLSLIGKGRQSCDTLLQIITRIIY